MREINERESTCSDSEDDSSLRPGSISDEQGAAREREHMVIGLQATPYDAVVFALVHYCDKMYNSTHGEAGLLLQLMFGIFLLVMSFTIQIVLVASLLMTTIYVEKVPYRGDLGAKIGALETVLASDPPLRLNTDDQLQGDALELCRVKNTLPMAHALVLLLWNARMLAEVFDALWRLNSIRSLPVVEFRGGQQLSPLIEDAPDKKEEYIVALTLRVRVICHCVVSMPQIVCALLLWWMGTNFLFFAHSMDLLIMKAISLSFITQLDEIMFSAFGSLRFKARVARTSFAYYCDPPSWHWSIWGVSIVKLGGAFVALFWVRDYFFQEVTTFRQLCDEYFRSYPFDFSKDYEHLWNSIVDVFQGLP